MHNMRKIKQNLVRTPCSLSTKLFLTNSMSFYQTVDRDVVQVCAQDLRHHRAPGGTQRKAAAHRTAPGRARPGTSRSGQGHQPHL